MSHCLYIDEEPKYGYSLTLNQVTDKFGKIKIKISELVKLSENDNFYGLYIKLDRAQDLTLGMKYYLEPDKQIEKIVDTSTKIHLTCDNNLPKLQFINGSPDFLIVKEDLEYYLSLSGQGQMLANFQLNKDEIFGDIDLKNWIFMIVFEFIFIQNMKFKIVPFIPSFINISLLESICIILM